MECVARELDGASDMDRMLSTPEPEPVAGDDPIVEEDDSEEEDEVRKETGSPATGRGIFTMRSPIWST